MNAARLVLPLLLALLPGWPWTPAQAAALAPDDVQRMVVEEALNSTVPPSLALAVARVESDFRVDAESSAGARGVMQIMPATAIGEFGVGPDELWDPRLNIQLGIHFLEQLITRYGGRWDAALSHYNGGSLRGSGRQVVPHAHTRDYVAAVLRWQRRYAAQAALWRPGPRQTVDAFVPARTRTDTPSMPPPVARPVERVKLLHNGLDDFDLDIERRRRAVRDRLDDLRFRVRWRSG